LKKINRGCTNEDAIRAMTLLRDCCYKTDIHLMPNLPGSNPKKDKEMFEYVLHSPDLQADQWKIYPCEITPWTVIKKWYDAGEYKPYSDDELIELLMDVKAQVHPWIRLNRVIRDIPSQYILGGMDEPNLRQVICNRMIKRGTPCRCIRCREVKTDDEAIASAELVIRKYRANEGKEFFISFETPDRSKICGFARLRLSKTPGAGIFPELEGAALVRELHVYGQLISTTDKQKKSHAQHTGFGTQLMQKSEEIAREHGFSKIAVIAGVGVRNFYRKLGFELEGEGELMIKHLPLLVEENNASALVRRYISSVVKDNISFIAENARRTEPAKVAAVVTLVAGVTTIAVALSRRKN
jgi:ELP3 family radical SAM enzyme/protein acetyltransferase